jgi:hypothetical protein
MVDMFKRQAATPAPAPKPAPPPVMPDPMSSDVLDAKRRAVATQGQAGRSSTVLTSAGSQTLAGGYSSTKLGTDA